MESASAQKQRVLEYVVAQTASCGFLQPSIHQSKSGSTYYEFKHKNASSVFKMRISTHHHPDLTDDIALYVIVGAGEIDWARIDRKLNYLNPNLCSICCRQLEEKERTLCAACCSDGYNKLLENMRLDSPTISPVFVHRVFNNLKAKASGAEGSPQSK